VAFTEAYVEADGFRIRYMQVGEGTPLVHLHGAGPPRVTRAHELLSQHHQVIVFEMPGFGQSPENAPTTTIRELASTMAAAIAGIGVGQFNLMGTSFGARVALWLALQQPEQVLALVLEAPAAIRPAGHQLPPTLDAKHRTLVTRLRGPDRDFQLEAAMRNLPTPTLVLFGTHDQNMPPELGHHYKELLPNCHLVFVYDAGHRISVDRPEAVADVTADFLERHEAFVINRNETVINP
jgi:pimeloyl-ACP methyl ester carboxylesterase